MCKLSDLLAKYYMSVKLQIFLGEKISFPEFASYC